jgi:methyl-accepting chemotaxis protein
MEIKSQIIAISFFLVLISVVCTATVAMRHFYSFTRKTATDEAKSSVAGLNEKIKEEMEKTRSFRDKLTDIPELARFVNEKDTKSLYNLTKPLIEAGGIDILMIAAADGEVLARPHDPSRIGDNVGSNADVKRLLRDESYEMFMTASSTKLGYYCGAPVKHKQRNKLRLVQKLRMPSTL